MKCSAQRPLARQGRRPESGHRWTQNSAGEPELTGRRKKEKEDVMNNIIWIVGAVVIVVFVLGFLGIR
jgi:hypothetical protein